MHRSPGLQILNSGHYSTIQDRGRPGHRAFGVPVGGALDIDSFDLANALLCNDLDAAAVELILLGGTFQATAPIALALTGADCRAEIRGKRQIVSPQTFTLEIDDVLTIGPMQNGLVAYLAVAGGFQTPQILSSRSREDRLVRDEFLPAVSSRTATRFVLVNPSKQEVCNEPIRVVDGIDFPVPDRLPHVTWQVATQSNRVGVRLEGPVLSGHSLPDRLSTPVSPGAIQVADGQLLILGPAGGTMGGYPVVAHVVSPDLGRLAQIPPGQPVRFQKIELAAALELDRKWLQTRADWLRRIRVATQSFELRPLLSELAGFGRLR